MFREDLQAVYREAFPVRLESRDVVYSVHSCIVQAVTVHIVIC